MSIDSPRPPAPDWAGLADALQRHMADLTHREGARLYGNDYYAEALRRTFGASEPGAARHRVPYPTVNTRTGLMTCAESDHLVNAHSVNNRLARESAEQQVVRLRAELARVYAEARQDIARDMRAWLNERRVPSVYRREGFQIAVDLIDPPAAEPPNAGQEEV